MVTYGKPTANQVINVYKAYEKLLNREVPIGWCKQSYVSRIREKSITVQHWREKTQKLLAKYFGVGEWPTWVHPDRTGVCEHHHVSRYSNGETAYNDCGWAFSLRTASPRTIEHAIKGEAKHCTRYAII